MATVFTPQPISQSASRSKSSVKVAKTRTGSALQSGGTATYTSRAPMSIPAARDSTTGRSSSLLPFLFRFLAAVFPPAPLVNFVMAHLVPALPAARSCEKNTLPIGIDSSRTAQVVNQCHKHGIWDQAPSRASTHHCVLWPTSR
jgi:hypothetical protein